MRQVLAVVVLVVVSGCTEWVSPPAETPVEPVAGACPEFRTIPGDATITNTAELVAFVAQGCVAIEGSVTVSGTDLTVVSLPGLVQAGGLEISDNPVLVGLDLPVLQRVLGKRTTGTCSPLGDHYSGGLGIVGNGSLETLVLPAVSSVGGAEISGNARLASVDLPALVTVTGNAGGTCPGGGEMGLTISGSAMPVVALPALVSGDLGLWDIGQLLAPSLTEGSLIVAVENLHLPAFTSGRIVAGGNVKTMDLPVLTSGYVEVNHAGQLESLSLPSFLSGEFVLWGTSLPALELPALEAATSIGILENSALSTVSLPALSSVTVQLSVYNNPALPQCAADAILAGLSVPPPNVDLFGNNPTCPP